MKIFVEEQRFTQLWLIALLVIFMVIVPLVALYSADFKPDTNEETLVIGLVLLANFLVFGMILLVKLITRIDEIGIHYRFYPFQVKFRTIPWHEIGKCYTRKYNAIREYGGWGIKPSLKRSKGKSYTVKGNMGLQIELKQGKKILIGTQHSDAVDRTLQNYNYKLEINDEV